MEKRSKLSALVGLSIRSGSAVFGIESIERSRRRVLAVITDGTLSENGKKRLSRLVESRNIEVIESNTAITEITGKANCKIIGLTDVNIIKGIRDERNNTKH